MGLLAFIKKIAPKPYTETGSGQSMEDPVRIVPRNLQSVIKRFEPIAKKYSYYNPSDPNYLRRATIGIVSVGFKSKWLEARYGKEGVGFRFGDRTYHLNGSIEQEVLRPGKEPKSFFFDLSAFYENQ